MYNKQAVNKKQAIIVYATKHPMATIAEIATRFDYRLGSTYNIIHGAGLHNPANELQRASIETLLRQARNATKTKWWQYMKQKAPWFT